MTKKTNEPSYKLTFDDAVSVHHMLWDGVLQSRIATHFDVNGGRVSEVNNDKLHPGSRAVAMRSYKKSA